MKYILSTFTGLLLILTACHQDQPSTFDQFFVNETLRIDYFHSGDANSETVKIEEGYRYDLWAGRMTNLLDTINYGTYYYKVYDYATQELIYSKGFDSYFKEYQYSQPAKEGVVKEFHESAIIPMPKEVIIFALEKRSPDGTMNEVYRTEITPKEAKEISVDPEVKVYTSLESGNPNVKADIAIIGEGYTLEEEQKFKDDLERYTEVFFKAEPCKSNKHKFNVRGVLKPSEDSGIDEPRAGIDKNTAVSASFNTMGSERYVLTEDNKALRDIAGHVPYDALYIMVNHARYGGGGIYNFYCVYTSDNIDSEYLMVHEFGHSFFGLADEYYTSSNALDDFYPAGFEPNEPNITAMQDPKNLKWKHLVSEGIEIPTPWEKAEYDKIDTEWQQKRRAMNDEIARLQKEGAPAEEIANAKANYDAQSAARNKAVQEYLESSEFAGMVGAFEGAGYVSTGLYRPSVNCIMFTRTDYFCPVCQEAMLRVIDSYAE
jgi:hypothetical protein